MAMSYGNTRPATETDDVGRYAMRGVLAGVPLVVTVRGDEIQTTRSKPVELSPDFAEVSFAPSVDFVEVSLAPSLTLGFESVSGADERLSVT